MDIQFPDLGAGTVRIDVRGRDISDGGVHDDFSLVLTVELATGVIAASELGELVGVNLRAGFRKWLGDAWPDEAVARSLRYSVLHDLPGAFLVSGYALLRDGLLMRSAESTVAARHSQADVCAGWDVRGPVYLNMVDHGVSPTPYGPVAPPLEAADPRSAIWLRKMVDARRTDLLGAVRTDEIVAELKALSEVEMLADEMDDWRRIYGAGKG